MPEPTMALGLAYKLHDHLVAGAACRYRGQPSSEHDRQTTACVARLGEIGEQREGMLKVCEDALGEICQTEWCEPSRMEGEDCGECRNANLRKRLLAVITGTQKEGSGI